MDEVNVEGAPTSLDAPPPSSPPGRGPTECPPSRPPRWRKSVGRVLFAAVVMVLLGYTLRDSIGVRYTTGYAPQVQPLPHGGVAVLDIKTTLDARGMLFDHRMRFEHGVMLLDNRNSASGSELLIADARVLIPRGTRALVRRRSAQWFDVTALEGSIELGIIKNAKLAQHTPATLEYAAGERVRMAASGEAVRSTPDLRGMKDDLAWVVDMATFRRMPLREVVQELNQVTQWSVEIVDPTIEQRLIDGAAFRGFQSTLDFLKAQGIDYEVRSFSEPVRLFALKSPATKSATSTHLDAPN